MKKPKIINTPFGEMDWATICDSDYENQNAQIGGKLMPEYAINLIAKSEIRDQQIYFDHSAVYGFIPFVGLEIEGRTVEGAFLFKVQKVVYSSIRDIFTCYGHKYHMGA